MRKFFNVAGPCVAEDHYMLPAQERCPGVGHLIDRKQFFVIHAARQSGKTTLLQDLVRTLNAAGTYHAVYCSLEAVQDITDPKDGIPAIVRGIRMAVEFHPALAGAPFAVDADFADFSNVLRASLSRYCTQLDKPLVVLFDEADCLSNGTLIAFLRQLRDGYVNRATIPFVHSLALVGMRDIRDYKIRVREGGDTLGSASPFNIVTKSMTLRGFTRDEVGALYRQHTDETGQAFPDEVTDYISDQTQGQPWLVNAVAREVVDEILGGDPVAGILPEHARQAVENIILRRDTHIDSLIERLKETRVRRIVEPIILGQDVEIDRISDDCRYVLDLGLIRDTKGVLSPLCPIYAEVIIRTLSYNTQYALPLELENRWMDGETLDMDGLLEAFQVFWRENSEIWAERYDYREAAPHLILMAFLQRVFNGGAHIAREFASGRKRLDLCVQYKERNYPVELKILRNEKTVHEGIEQLSAYMDAVESDRGWLLVFDRRPDTSWSEKIYRRQEETTNSRGRIQLLGC